MRKVAVIMGSTSDLPVAEKAIQVLKEYEIETEVRVLSAHRCPNEAREFASSARESGFSCIIALAGMAAHLAGAMAANTTLPVIGVPCSGAKLDGMDALLSTVQMPSGIPVATVAIDGAKNAAILAIQIMAVADAAAESGNALTEIVTSTKILRKLAANKGIQTLIYGTVGAGTYVPAGRIRSLFAELFGFGVITTNDLRYKTQTASGNEATKRFFPEDKMAFLSNGTASSFGVGLWGVTPEEADYGQYNDKSMDQFITITQWATPDPVAVWTKASGVFIPVVPNPTGLFIAADTSK